MTALNGGSGKSTTPQTRQNRCYSTDSAAGDLAAESEGSCVYVGADDDANTQWAWPFEEASDDDRFGHMAGAHHVLHRSVKLHADLHGVGTPAVPHKHLTPLEALMLRMEGSR